MSNKDNIKKRKSTKGLTLLELLIAIMMFAFICEVIFAVYIGLFKLWDQNFDYAKAEDEVRRAYLRVSAELRMASSVDLDNKNSSILEFENNGSKVFYLHNETVSYKDFRDGLYPAGGTYLRLLDEKKIDKNNYGYGAVIAKNLKPPEGSGGTRFVVEPSGLVRFQIVSNHEAYLTTINMKVLPRN